MPKFALIADGIVVDVLEVDAAVPPPSHASYVEVPADVFPGWVVSGESFARVPIRWGNVRAYRDDRIAWAAAILDRHRNQRDFGLATTITDAKAIEVASYMQALRDITKAATPNDVVWPTQPL